MPDFIVAFHSGFADTESYRWQPTLTCLLELDKPTLFTTDNDEEAREEVDVLTSMGARFLKS